MKKFVCQICGYVYEGEAAPEYCPQCKAPASKFTEMCGDRTWAAEHIVGIAKDVAEDIKMDLRANFTGECTEVGMYLAMSRVAHREGYPEIGMYWEKAAFEEAEHAAKFAELLGEVVTDSTQKNLEMRVEAENGATAGKFDLASRAKAAGLDAIHDTVHEMAKDPPRQSFRRSPETLFQQIISTLPTTFIHHLLPSTKTAPVSFRKQGLFDFTHHIFLYSYIRLNFFTTVADSYQSFSLCGP